MERFTRGDNIGLLAVQHSLRKQPRGSQCNQAEMGVPQTTLQYIYSIAGDMSLTRFCRILHER